MKIPKPNKTGKNERRTDKMPNWCEGTLRLKGKFANLKRFLLEGLEAVDMNGNKKNGYRIAMDDDNNFWITDIKHDLYIKGSNRHFAKGILGDIELYTEDIEKETVLALPIKAAWIVDFNVLINISRAYEVNARIHSYEKGAEFEQIIDIQHGELKYYKMVEHNDYQWDCDCPLIGG